MTTRLTDITRFDNGARFYAADLHVHSYGASADVSDSQMTVEAIVDAAVADKLAVLAITDHNTDKHVLQSIDYATKYADRLLVLAGVEITTANGHLLVYFAPERADGVTKLLARINLVGQQGARDSHTTASMADVMAEAEKLGGLCVAAHIDRAKMGFEMLADGHPNFKRDIITSSGLYGLEFDDSAHLGWYSLDDEPTPQGAGRKGLLQARTQSTTTVARPYLAALQNSDAHSMKEFLDQHAKRVGTRIKMTALGFDGVRTAFIDPEARVRATATLPEAIPRVRGVQINGGFLDGTTLHFSDNLNCFIGGRGTGKSTAIRSVAYGLGVRDDLESQDNCPDSVVVYGEDANGVLYRYERINGQSPTVQAKEDQSISNVPVDSFRIEFYAQGDLGAVSKDPLRNPQLLQEFLDRHIVLDDLCAEEAAILEELEQNSALLSPLEATAAQLKAKETSLSQVNSKLTIAETGRVKEIAGDQTKLAAEKNLGAALREIELFYRRGISLKNFYRSLDAIAVDAGDLTGKPETTTLLSNARTILANATKFLADQEKSITARLTQIANDLGGTLRDLASAHQKIDDELNQRIVALQKKGLAGTIKELQDLIGQRTRLSTEVARIRGQSAELQQLRDKREELLASLATVRSQKAERRKRQLAAINKNLRQTIDDYLVNLYYESSGVVDAFKHCVILVMQGSYLQEDLIDRFCLNCTPQDLASLIRAQDIQAIAKIGNIGAQWAPPIAERFRVLTNLHALEVIDKPPRPVIKVLTKGSPPKQIPVNQLSDGQKHTILLTIAMLAESKLPLIMDQPEDDLDNAFIFKSVVSTLRAIKERRQVILVTHNANIAVLGDSELIFPMKRASDTGAVFDRGAIDHPDTREAVQHVLEGGEIAFKRRMAIYGH